MKMKRMVVELRIKQFFMCQSIHTRMAYSAYEVSVQAFLKGDKILSPFTSRHCTHAVTALITLLYTFSCA